MGHKVKTNCQGFPGEFCLWSDLMTGSYDAIRTEKRFMKHLYINVEWLSKGIIARMKVKWGRLLGEEVDHLIRFVYTELSRLNLKRQKKEKRITRWCQGLSKLMLQSWPSTVSNVQPESSSFPEAGLPRCKAQCSSLHFTDPVPVQRGEREYLTDPPEVGRVTL